MCYEQLWLHETRGGGGGGKKIKNQSKGGVQQMNKQNLCRVYVVWKMRKLERTKSAHTLICVMEATYSLNGTKIRTNM
jgi:hypothetical protein